MSEEIKTSSNGNWASSSSNQHFFLSFLLGHHYDFSVDYRFKLIRRAFPVGNTAAKDVLWQNYIRSNPCWCKGAEIDHWLLVRWLWKRAFLATEVFLGVLEKWWLKQNSDLAHFNTCQISSCSVAIRNSSHHSQIIVFLTWTHTKRAIQRCVPMPLAPRGCYRTSGWHWGSVFCLILSLGFHHCSSSLGSTYSKRKFFLYNGQSCLYSMM